jgi:hypothetical protein
MLVVGTAICSVNVADSVLGSGERKPLLALALLGVFVFIAIGLGYGDGATGNAIARRQIVQFVIIGLISLAVFTVVYLLTYLVGRSGFRQNENPTESPSRHAKP